jgi:hypothetical protein
MTDPGLQTATGQAKQAGYFANFFNGISSLFSKSSTPQAVLNYQTGPSTYVPNVATDGIDAVEAYNNAMLQTTTNIPINTPSKAPIDWPQTLNPVNLFSGQGIIREGSTSPLAQSVFDAPGKAVDAGKKIATGVALTTIVILVFFGFLLYLLVKQGNVGVRA